MASPFPDQPPRTIPRSNSPRATASATGRMKIRVVARLLRIGAEVANAMAVGQKHGLKDLLVLEACVV